MLEDFKELRDEELGISCPLQRELTEEEWQAFLKCARHGFRTCDRIHNEFTPKIEEHDITELQIERALHPRSRLIAYEHEGMARLGLYDPEQCIFLIGTLPKGEFFNAFEREEIDRYAANLEDVRWLRE